jgi:hypothetical protein
VIVATARSVTLVFTNNLVNDANVSVNGTVVGRVTAGLTQQTTISAPSSMSVSFDVIASTLTSGTSVGDAMSGVYNTINNPSGTINFTIGPQIGTSQFFAPKVNNNTSVGLLMMVNGGLAHENRCNCVVPAFQQNTIFGYYYLFSNGNLRAYLDGSNYTGPYQYFQNFAGSWNSTTGVILFTYNTAP